MKPLLLAGLMLLCFATPSFAATDAFNFIRNDCNGNRHDLFAELDSGYCVILEYAMTCSSCINGARKVDAMLKRFDDATRAKIRFYILAYTNTYSCTAMQNFVSANSLPCIPFDSGASQCAYYGGFGMPTFVIVGGKDRKVLFTGIGFATKDTIAMASALRSFFNISPVADESQYDNCVIQIAPNPAMDVVNVSFNEPVHGVITLRIVDQNGVERVSTRFEGSDKAPLIPVSTEALENGTYLIETRYDQIVRTQKLVVVR